MTAKLLSLLPVGYNVKSVRKVLLSCYLLTFFCSVILYLNKLFTALDSLYYYNDAGKKFLDTSEIMTAFPSLRNNCFDIFAVFIISLMGFLVYNFIYHYIGSKSIYTMLRVGRRELIKRCTAVPLTIIFISIITVIILNFLYYGLYILLTPEECILPLVWKTWWRF